MSPTINLPHPHEVVRSCFTCGREGVTSGDGHLADCGEPCVPGHTVVTCVHCKAAALERRVAWMEKRVAAYAGVVLAAQAYVDAKAAVDAGTTDQGTFEDRVSFMERMHDELVEALAELRRVNAEEVCR